MRARPALGVCATGDGGAALARVRQEGGRGARIVREYAQRAAACDRVRAELREEREALPALRVVAPALGRRRVVHAAGRVEEALVQLDGKRTRLGGELMRERGGSYKGANVGKREICHALEAEAREGG